MNAITRHGGTRGAQPGWLARHAPARRSAGAAVAVAAGLALLVPSAAWAAPAAAGVSRAGHASRPSVTIQFLGVSCPTTHMCAAVGGASTDGPAWAEVAKGSRWSVTPVPLPAGATGGGLAAVSCTAADACTAVGFYSFAPSGTAPLAERWNGRRWAVQPTPSPEGESGAIPFNAVSCASATSCTAVGYYDFGDISFTDSSLVEHWDGTSWAIQPTPPIGDPGSDLTGVSCPAVSACTAAGYYLGQSDEGPGSSPLAMGWQGTDWVIQHTPGAVYATGNSIVGLAAISCPSASACTAVGGNYDENPYVLHWNGTHWRTQAVSGGSTLNEMTGVSCPSATACTAVAGGVADRWDGHTWSVQQLRSPGGAHGIDVNEVSCPSLVRCTAVGWASFSRGQLPLVEHWNGRHWSLQTAQIPPAASAR
jgi:hypothetical protein